MLFTQSLGVLADAEGVSGSGGVHSVLGPGQSRSCSCGALLQYPVPILMAVACRNAAGEGIPTNREIP